MVCTGMHLEFPFRDHPRLLSSDFDRLSRKRLHTIYCLDYGILRFPKLGLQMKSQKAHWLNVQYKICKTVKTGKWLKQMASGRFPSYRKLLNLNPLTNFQSFDVKIIFVMCYFRNLTRGPHISSRVKIVLRKTQIPLNSYFKTIFRTYLPA